MDSFIFFIIIGLSGVAVTIQLIYILHWIKQWRRKAQDAQSGMESLKPDDTTLPVSSVPETTPADITSPRFNVEETQTKSENIIHRAIGQANRIIANAELKGISILAKEKILSQKISTEQQQEYEKVEKALTEQLEKSAQDAQGSYGQFMKTLQDRVNEHLEANQKLIDEKADTMIASAQTTLEAFVTDVHKRVAEQVDKELDAARKEIEEYKEHRMRVIDERIVDMLQDILEVTLGKKLDLSDQSDLIYQALEEAKKENSFTATA